MEGISRCPVLVSYSTVKGSQAVMLDLQGNRMSPTCRAPRHRLIAYGGTMWNALAAEARKERATNAMHFMTGRKEEREVKMKRGRPAYLYSQRRSLSSP